jgi:hypothetical protein
VPCECGQQTPLPDKRARQKRAFVLTQKAYTLRVTKAAEQQGDRKRH